MDAGTDLRIGPTPATLRGPAADRLRPAVVAGRFRGGGRRPGASGAARAAAGGTDG